MAGLEVVERLELVGQVVDEVGWVGSFTGDMFHQVFGQVDGTEGVHMLSHPVQDGGCIAICQPLVKIWEDLLEGVEKLSGVEVPKRVGWEVAKATGPVYILQDSLGIV